MFAYTPTVPGQVVSVSDDVPSPLPSGHKSTDYYGCGNMVEATWQFDGNSFTPPYVAPVVATPTAEQVLQQNAQLALNLSDITVVRCYSADVAVPSAWQTYRAALRAIVNGSDTTSISLPSTPAYPAGT